MRFGLHEIHRSTLLMTFAYPYVHRLLCNVASAPCGRIFCGHQSVLKLLNWFFLSFLLHRLTAHMLPLASGILAFLGILRHAAAGPLKRIIASFLKSNLSNSRVYEHRRRLKECLYPYCFFAIWAFD